MCAAVEEVQVPELLFDTPSRSSLLEPGTEAASREQGGWQWVSGPNPHPTWRGGQETFPGGWLELRDNKMKETDTPIPKPLIWDGLREEYAPCAEPFQLTRHVLDGSQTTRELSAEVARWGDEVQRWEDQSSEKKLYVSIANAMAEKMTKLENEVRNELHAHL
jgi:hypothetical protein